MIPLASTATCDIDDSLVQRITNFETLFASVVMLQN